MCERVRVKHEAVRRSCETCAGALSRWRNALSQRCSGWLTRTLGAEAHVCRSGCQCGRGPAERCHVTKSGVEDARRESTAAFAGGAALACAAAAAAAAADVVIFKVLLGICAQLGV